MITGDAAGSAARKVDARSIAWVIGVVATLVVLAGLGLVTMAWSASWSTKLSRLTHAAVTGFVLLGFVLLADEAVARGMRPLRTYAVAIALGSVLGSMLGYEVRGWLHLNYGVAAGLMKEVTPRFAWTRRVDMMIMCALVGSLATHAHVSRRNAMAARRRQQVAEVERARAQRRTLESELQALQARVEPGFLFDTLGRIRSLYRSDEAAAGTMLEDLIVYLRAALPHLRESTSTVHQEMTLATAWLDIVARSSVRLELALDVDAAARDGCLPALVLLPLVQGALGDAGEHPVRMRLAVRADERQLRVEIETSTSAFASPVRAPLDSLSERLSALHGANASLLATAARDGGSRAEVNLPLEFAAGRNAETSLPVHVIGREQSEHMGTRKERGKPVMTSD